MIKTDLLRDRIADVSRKIIRLWGEPAQLGMMVEECGELIVAIHHYSRGKCSKGDVISEIADVMVVAGQLSETFGEKGEVEAVITQKLNRLDYRIKHSNGAEQWTHIKNS